MEQLSATPSFIIFDKETEMHVDLMVLPFADWQALQEALDDLRAARRAQAAYEDWRRDPSLGRPWAEVKAEMIQDGPFDA
jgi:hypothetical protein